MQVRLERIYAGVAAEFLISWAPSTASQEPPGASEHVSDIHFEHNSISEFDLF